MTAPAPADVVEPLVPMAGVDDVGLVVSDVRRGTLLRTALGVVPAIDDIPASHKVAVRPIDARAPVHKYGEVIGIARDDIPPRRARTFAQPRSRAAQRERTTALPWHVIAMDSAGHADA